MKKWILRTALVCIAVALLSVLLLRWFNPEPRHQGRPLSQWVEDLGSRDFKIREDAVAALRAMGPEAVPYLSGELTAGGTPAQRAVESIARHVPEFLRRPLRRIYSPSRAAIRKQVALHAISAMGTNAMDALPALGQVLRESHVGLSSAAAAALTQMGTNSLPILIAALDDGDFNIRSAACNSLGSLRSNAVPALPRLTRIIKEERGAIASAAMLALSRMGEPAVLTLVECLGHTNSIVRQSGAFALAHMGPAARSAVPMLINAVADENPIVRKHVLQALAGANGNAPETSALLLAALEDPDPEVRLVAVTALGIRSRAMRENLPTFYRLLEDNSPPVRAAAAWALGQIGEHGGGAVPHLERLVADTNSLVRQNAAKALETIRASMATGITSQR